MSISQIIYVSQSAEYLTKDEIQIMVNQFQSKNVKKNVTGVLLYCADRFMQLIEGESETIDSLYSNIKKDPRHTNVICLMSRKVEVRSFPDWGMLLMYYDKSHSMMSEKIHKFEKIKDESTDQSQLAFDLLLEFITPSSI